MAQRIAVIETKGLTFDGDIRPEDLAENLDALMDPTDAPAATVDLWT